MTENDLVMITGANSGIGRATSIKLASRGVRIVGIARREDKLKEVKNACPDGRFEYVVADFGMDVASLDVLVDELVKKYGKFSGFVHSAGMISVQPLVIFDYDSAIREFNVNLFSAIELLKGLLRRKNRQELLNVCLVSSIVAETGNPGSLIYSLTKAGLCNLVKTLLLETGNKDVRINSVMLGVLDTDMVKRYGEEAGYNQLEATAKYNFNGQPGKPGYAADVIAFLLSRESYWINGQNIAVDGGWLTGGGIGMEKNS